MSLGATPPATRRSQPPNIKAFQSPHASSRLPLLTIPFSDLAILRFWKGAPSMIRMTTGSTGTWRENLPKTQPLASLFQPQFKASELRVWTERYLPQLPGLCRHQEGELEAGRQIQQLLLVASVCNRTAWQTSQERKWRCSQYEPNQVSRGDKRWRRLWGAENDHFLVVAWAPTLQPDTHHGVAALLDIDVNTTERPCPEVPNAHDNFPRTKSHKNHIKLQEWLFNFWNEKAET